MSFLKDFKDEISQAVNELVSSDENNTKDMDTDNQKKELESEDASVHMNKLNYQNGDTDETNQSITEKEDMVMAKQSKKSKETNDEKDKYTNMDNNLDEKEDEMVNTLDEEDNNQMDMAMINELFGTDTKDLSLDLDNEEQDESDKELDSQLEKELTTDMNDINSNKDNKDVVNTFAYKEEKSDEDIKAALRGGRTMQAVEKYDTSDLGVKEESNLVSEDVAEVTKGTMIDGNIISEGSMNVYGKIKGNVACRGKLVVSGTIIGASRAAEVYTSNAKIDGDVTSDGSIKIGNGSVIIGNIYGSSAVIAGAIQGDIDVHGPVIIDGTAVVQGNIRSRSVQINNGAAIEGMVSQCYAEIDYAALFDKTFSK